LISSNAQLKQAIPRHQKTFTWGIETGEIGNKFLSIFKGSRCIHDVDNIPYHPLALLAMRWGSKIEQLTLTNAKMGSSRTLNFSKQFIYVLDAKKTSSHFLLESIAFCGFLISFSHNGAFSSVIPSPRLPTSRLGFESRSWNSIFL